VYDFLLRLAKRRVAQIGLTATAAAAKVDKSQLSRWLAAGDKRRELKADAFCRLADSLGVDLSWGGWPQERTEL
jgi:hypothetical protein